MRLKYVLNEVLVGLWRNVTMTIAMIITMSVSLTMLGASVLLYMQVDQMKNYYYGEIEVSVFLRTDVTDAQRQRDRQRDHEQPAGQGAAPTRPASRRSSASRSCGRTRPTSSSRSARTACPSRSGSS